MIRTISSVTLILSMMTLAGCAQGGGGVGNIPAASAPASTSTSTANGGGTNAGTSGTTGTASKSLFSSWSYNNGLLTVNLTGGVFDQSRSVSGSALGQSCTCNGNPHGTEAQGTIAISSCTGSSNCSQLEANWTYTKSSTTLTFCSTPSQCYQMQ